MRDFVFENKTKVYFGKDELQHLHEEIGRFGKKVLLVYGGGSIKRIGLYDKVMAQLKEAGAEVFELAGVEPNPRHTTVNKGAAICKKEGIDVLLAVGGGSTIDATKGIVGVTAKFAEVDTVNTFIDRLNEQNCFYEINYTGYSEINASGEWVANLECILSEDAGR